MYRFYGWRFPTVGAFMARAGRQPGRWDTEPPPACEGHGPERFAYGPLAFHVRTPPADDHRGAHRRSRVALSSAANRTTKAHWMGRGSLPEEDGTSSPSPHWGRRGASADQRATVTTPASHRAACSALGGKIRPRSPEVLEKTWRKPTESVEKTLNFPAPCSAPFRQGGCRVNTMAMSYAVMPVTFCRGYAGVLDLVPSLR
jgi:hypothetical protein